MLRVQILKKTVCDIQDITGTACSIWNVDGNCLAHSGGKEKELSDFIKELPEEEEWEENNASFFGVSSEEGLIYVLVLHSVLPEMKMAGRLGVKQLEGYLRLYQEKMNRNHFIQNLLLDNLLLVDVYNRAKNMHIPIEARRAVIMIEPKNPNDNLILEVLKGLYETSTKDFVTAVDESHIILVKMLEDREGYKELNKIAKYIVDILNTEAMVNVRVAYGTIVDEIKDVSKSYKGRLIHQLPISLCDMFLSEIFEGKEIEFDEETLTTVHKFFDNNLNISETARQLFLHRNTLVYRLEKIQKKTGLDVRVFDDALTFKIALMVSNHLKSLQKSAQSNAKEETKW